MTRLQDLIDDFAARNDYKPKTAKFLDLDRSGDDPLFLLADAAGTMTGQNYFTHVDTTRPSGGSTAHGSV